MSFLKIGSGAVVHWVYVHTFPLSWPVLVKLCIRDFHIMPQSSCEFWKNRGIESGTVIRDVCVLTTLSPFSSIWMKFVGIRGARNYWIVMSFMKIDAARVILCIRLWVKFYPHFSHLFTEWLKFGLSDLQLICKFRENWQSEVRTFLMDVSEMSFSWSVCAPSWSGPTPFCSFIQIVVLVWYSQVQFVPRDRNLWNVDSTADITHTWSIHKRGSDM
jgi:hypothetical protein